MLPWRISVIVALGIFLICLFILGVFKFRKNLYYKAFVQDDNFKTDKVGGTKNKYFLVLSDTKKYIKRYVIRKSVYENSFICNFNKQYKSITYYIVCYGFGRRVIEVIKVTEKNTNNSSKIIALKQACKNVNIVIRDVDGLLLNTNVIKPLPLKKIKLFALYSGIALMCGLYIVRHIALEIILGQYCKPYLDGIYNLISIVVILLISLAYYFMSVSTMKKRNCKNRNGGALEYEFF